MNERVKVVKIVKVAKVVKVFQNIPGSQLLSDFKNFFSKTFVFFFRKNNKEKSGTELTSSSSKLEEVTS